MISNNSIFGYPSQCELCTSFGESIKLSVEPYYKEGSKFRLMIVGQDPTIYNEPERVKQVLMLDKENSQLSRWLKNIFGKNKFYDVTIYATNLIKCSFSKPPTLLGGQNFIKKYFNKCKSYLINEISNYNLIVSFLRRTGT